MSNVMSMKNVRNTVHRSSFDLSRKNAFTTIAGALTPCFVQEVLPGDSFEFDVSNFTRTSPVNTAAFVRMKENVDFFFVPYSLLWDKWEQFIAQTDDPHYASSFSSPAANFSSTPYCKLGSIAHLLHDFVSSSSSAVIQSFVPGGTSFGEGFQRLLETLGYGGIASLVSDMDQTFSLSDDYSDMAVSLFRFAAYQKIYYDHYRDSQWEPSKPQNYNFDYVLRDSDTLINFYSDPNYAAPSSSSKMFDNMFTLRFANYRKDKFMGILPSPQFGDVAVAGPVLGNLSVRLSPISSSSSSNVRARPDGVFSVNDSSSSVNSSLVLDSLNNTSGISVLAMRLAEATQKYREITLTGSKDYRDQIFKHWNAKVPSYASTVCQRLFSYDSSLDISEVVNQNIQQGIDADIAGKGVSAGRGKFRWKNSDGQFGIIMGIYHCEPLLDYSLPMSCDSQIFCVTPDSYPIPEYDSIGMEEVYKRDLLMVDGGSSPLSVLGYAPRYFQWKSSVDRTLCGFNFKSSYGAWVSSLAPHSFRSALGYTEYSYLTKKVVPQLLNSIFVAQVSLSGSTKSGSAYTFDTDQFLVNMFIGCKCARNLSSDGLPY